MGPAAQGRGDGHCGTGRSGAASARGGPGALPRGRCVAACSSDNKIIDQGAEHSLMHGWDTSRWPVILGHEGCVTAVEVGRNWVDSIRWGSAMPSSPRCPSALAPPRALRQQRARRAQERSGIRFPASTPSTCSSIRRSSPPPAWCRCPTRAAALRLRALRAHLLRAGGAAAHRSCGRGGTRHAAAGAVGDADRWCDAGAGRRADGPVACRDRA